MNKSVAPTIPHAHNSGQKFSQCNRLKNSVIVVTRNPQKSEANKKEPRQQRTWYFRKTRKMERKQKSGKNASMIVCVFKRLNLSYFENFGEFIFLVEPLYHAEKIEWVANRVRPFQIYRDRSDK
jgi:hypothetical protein